MKVTKKKIERAAKALYEDGWESNPIPEHYAWENLEEQDVYRHWARVVLEAVKEKKKT